MAKFKVFTISDTKTKEVEWYEVTDADKKEGKWEDDGLGAAKFPVGLRHDKETQKRRAEQYADYLNSLIKEDPPIKNFVV